MGQEADFALPRQRGAWTPVSQAADHPLALLDGQLLAGARLRVLLGRTSRFGARYFAVVLVSADGRSSQEPVLSGLQRSGPLPSYNWIEVAETNAQVAVSDASNIDVGPEGIRRLFELLLAALPLGGHLMVEYDSPEREETAQALTHGVPPLAAPLGELLFRIGFGAHFKDWQIAEGGSEGPRKLQAYKPASREDAHRWRRQAARQLQEFLEAPTPTLAAVLKARERAAALLPALNKTQR